MDYLEAAKARLAEIEGEHPAWQVDSLVRVAIADALVAIAEAACHALKLVPERTCTVLWRDNFAECEAGQGERWPECSECGEELPYGYAMAVIASYCPECGAKVVSA